jgi:hypothetical protein
VSEFDPATSDGCSVPEFLKKQFTFLRVFCERCDATACRVHDDGYERGGSEADRVVLDFGLFGAARSSCDDFTAVQVFNTVRSVGASHWGTGEKWHGGERAWPQPQEAP